MLSTSVHGQTIMLKRSKAIIHVRAHSTDFSVNEVNRDVNSEIKLRHHCKHACETMKEAICDYHCIRLLSSCTSLIIIHDKIMITNFLTILIMIIAGIIVITIIITITIIIIVVVNIITITTIVIIVIVIAMLLLLVLLLLV